MDFLLSLNQNMKLILTQNMKLSMKILEMSSLNLKEFLEKECHKNPMLEVVYTSSTNKNFSDEENLTSPFDFLSKEESLLDNLEEQISYFNLSKKDKNICVYIVNNLDNRGYLAISKDEIKKKFNLSISELNYIFQFIHKLEPYGIGSINLQESLKIQLSFKNNSDPILLAIIDNFLEDLANKKFDLIAKALNISTKKVEEYLNIIKTLNPIPARGYFIGNKINYIVPEAKIVIINNNLKVILNQDAIPKIKLNCFQSNNLNYQNALNLIKAIEKRYITLEKILNLLIIQQKDFFFLGKDYLKTLTLKDIANELNLHISTISRAIKEKYIETPMGIIEIKNLFIVDSKTITIKNLIEEFIKNENKSSPLSDENISNLLQNKGFKVARRTVAKYRNELGILSTRTRKK